jgi:hypothetical protein
MNTLPIPAKLRSRTGFAHRALKYFLLISTMLLFGCAGRQLGRSDARKVLASIPGIRLPQENISIEGITQLDGQHAVAEAIIRTGFKLEKSGDQWIVSEMRLENGRWVRIDELYKRLSDRQNRQTQEDMNLIALGLERYRLRNAGYPEAGEFTKLMDLLYPRYIAKMVVKDAWANPLLYRCDGPIQYTITSTGADGKLGTKDDIVLKGGNF